MRYNREAAVSYARKWALSRNPAYYNYDYLGGDCTNFVSQCLYAGIPQMNYREYGWYYENANRKSPSWTGVKYLYEFLIANQYEGPRGREIAREELEIGDVIQLSFGSGIYGHCLIVTEIQGDEILICAHTVDSKDRPLRTYSYEKARYLKIY
ncbi:MAG: amidase domain-containing protein [Clostridia bacterium]|nr:amidase domain-containing protein [Clostridia bacterium]